MIDDSIVRGTTCAAIVGLLRRPGQKKCMSGCPPPFMNPCYYGTDIDSRDNHRPNIPWRDRPQIGRQSGLSAGGGSGLPHKSRLRRGRLLRGLL